MEKQRNDNTLFKAVFRFSGSAVLKCGEITYELLPENVYLVPYGARHSFH